MNKQPGMSIDRFKEDYEGQPVWDLGEPQKYFVDVFSKSIPQSPILEVGCGTGNLSKFVAGLGCEIIGIDFAPKAIELAKEKSEGMSSKLSFRVLDAFRLEDLGRQFNTVLDCYFFHLLDDDTRENYASILHRVLKPGGKLYMLGFAVKLRIPGTPRGVTKDDILSTFKEGWSILDLGSTTVDVNFLPEGLPGTFACIEKDA